MSKQASIWKETKRPVGLEARVEFPGYDQTRDFLDALADLSEATGVYPNISFGRNYASLTLQVEDGADAMSDEQRAFAQRSDALLGEQKTLKVVA